MRPRRQPTDRALTFDWDAHDGGTGRLLLAGLITTGALVGLFLAFRIITPETRPVTTRPQQVLVLNPNVPAERALINQAIDRSFALIPADGVAATLPSAAQLPAFRPGIAAFTLTPRPLSAGATASERPHFFSLDMGVAGTPAATPRPLPDPPPSVLRVTLEGQAAARLAQSGELPGIPLVDSTRPRFQVAVGARGQVLMALPLTASEDPAVMEQLRAAVMNLRFTPNKKSVEWAQAGFRWEQAKTP